jgi:hypothetical protein
MAGRASGSALTARRFRRPGLSKTRQPAYNRDLESHL